jgi:hypothetical protein
LLHHKDTLGNDDHEGHFATLPAWKVFLYGPRFPVDLNLAAWRRGGLRWRRVAADPCQIPQKNRRRYAGTMMATFANASQA